MTSPWPGNAQCLVNITVDFDGLSNEAGKKLLPQGIHSHGRYSAKRGVPRMLEIFARHGIHATFFVPGYDAEHFPEAVKAIHAAGHEIGAHGYLHESFDLGEEEPFYLRKSHQILTDLLGEAPVGWRNPGGGKSEQTLKVLVDLGYIYDSSEKASDWPYIPTIANTPLCGFINLPDNVSSLDDAPFYRDSLTPPSEVLEQWKLEFHMAYSEGAYFDLIVHPRMGFGSGSPARAQVLDDLIAFIKTYPGVVFQRQKDTAAWCLQTPDSWPVRRNPRTVQGVN
ncbi:polysaccharide deacetylase family protein [Hoeflea alexandrii]|uniref:polysaccharide deacetylase family protein n=1 Tax=Hoeflea alexandrii TaxID=288436 RepID=UPI0022AEBC23|nr:polysaccharide deacetylase family protein [Hoeflea alexandrii]MCZ4291011.1 polysaccharide deacetylase family protein [Hoeflea alexandrii]